MYTQKSAGFSLIELIVTIVIAGILATMAVPSFKGFLEQSRVDAAANDLYSAISLARNEAILRNTSIRLCRSTDLASCDASGIDWNAGWIVMVSSNNQLIKAWNSAMPAIIAPLGGRNNFLTNITFNPDNSLDGLAAGITFTINEGNANKSVIINSLGKPRIQ